MNAQPANQSKVQSNVQSNVQSSGINWLFNQMNNRLTNLRTQKIRIKISDVLRPEEQVKLRRLQDEIESTRERLDRHTDTFDNVH